ncbi:MAG: DinB family protein [Dehalococcoidia bacterium]|nr:DinB family protein [Dehalococcoidia bacterium]
MDAIQLLKENFSGARMEVAGTIADVTPAMANWQPPGVANPIGALYVHMLHAQDMVVHQMVQGKKTIWENEGWDKKVKLAFGGLTPEARNAKIDLATVKPYADAVAKAVDACLNSLKPADLDRKINVGPPIGEMSLGSIIQAFGVGHMLSHLGEISALKGIQGKKGYPF